MTDQAAVFLDRDGVINRRRMTLVRKRGHLEILPGVPEAVARISEAGYRVVVTTNQRPVSWGVISPKALDGIHREITKAVEQAGGHIDAFRACTHGYFEDCTCGKPEPGMLESAAAELGLDPERCWMVGDKPSDIEAGQRFGARTVWVTGERFPWEYLRGSPDPDVRVEGLPEAVDRILAEDGHGSDGPG